jgi:hypothetical protein
LALVWLLAASKPKSFLDIVIRWLQKNNKFMKFNMKFTMRFTMRFTKIMKFTMFMKKLASDVSVVIVSSPLGVKTIPQGPG